MHHDDLLFATMIAIIGVCWLFGLLLAIMYATRGDWFPVVHYLGFTSLGAVGCIRAMQA